MFCFCHNCTPRARGRRPHTYLLSHLWFPVLSLLALGAPLWPWHPSFLPAFGSGGGSYADRWTGHQLCTPRALSLPEEGGQSPQCSDSWHFLWSPSQGVWSRGLRHDKPLCCYPTPLADTYHLYDLETKMRWLGERNCMLTFCTTEVCDWLR